MHYSVIVGACLGIGNKSVPASALYRDIVLCLDDSLAEVVARVGCIAVGDSILGAVNKVYRRILGVCDEYRRSALARNLSSVEENLDRFRVCGLVRDVDVYLSVVERAVNVDST